MCDQTCGKEEDYEVVTLVGFLPNSAVGLEGDLVEVCR